MQVVAGDIIVCFATPIPGMAVTSSAADGCTALNASSNCFIRHLCCSYVAGVLYCDRVANGLGYAQQRTPSEICELLGTGFVRRLGHKTDLGLCLGVHRWCSFKMATLYFTVHCISTKCHSAKLQWSQYFLVYRNFTKNAIRYKS